MSAPPNNGLQRSAIRRLATADAESFAAKM
jgi:hypothetical protein